MDHVEDGKINPDGSFHDNVAVWHWQIWDCENTEKDVTIGFKQKNFIGEKSVIKEDEEFVGIDASVHIGIGGHIKIGVKGISLSDLLFFL